MAEALEKPRILWGAGTPRTMRAHWILHELQLDYQRRPIGPRTGETQTAEFTKINPGQKIPVLQDGEFTLSESAAIVTYVGDSYGSAAGLVPPPKSRERALYYKWCFCVMTELDAHTLYVIRKHLDLKHIYGEAPNAVQAAKEGFQKQAATAGEQLAAQGPYLLGKRFSGADILLTTCLVSAARREIALTATLHEYMERVTARPAYRSALKANVCE